MTDMIANDLTNYQKLIYESDDDGILLGGRQIGKTELLCRRAKKALLSEENTVVLGPTHRMAMEISKRFRESVPQCDPDTDVHLTEVSRPDATVRFHAASMVDPEKLDTRSGPLYFDGEEADVVIVDEATYIDEPILRPFRFYLNDAEIIMTGTATEDGNHILERWAEGSDVVSVRVPTVAAPFVEYDRIQTMIDADPYRIRTAEWRAH